LSLAQSETLPRDLVSMAPWEIAVPWCNSCAH